jgi:streptogramin lyase
MNPLRTAALAGAAFAGLSAAGCVTTETGMGAAMDARLTAPKTFGGFTGPESATYDAEHDRFLVGNTGGSGPGHITALNPDGSVQNALWAVGSDTVDLNNPLGTQAHDGVLYAVDTPYIRRFDLDTGAALPSVLIEGAQILNDLDIGANGSIYVTEMGSQDPDSWKVMKVAPDGTVSTFAQGEALGRPNGLDIGPDGRIYLAPVAIAAMVVLDPDGSVAETVPLPDRSNDGIIALADSVIVSRPGGGVIERVWKDGRVETLTDKTPGGASIGYDPTRKRIIAPSVRQNTISLLDLP